MPHHPCESSTLPADLIEAARVAGAGTARIITRIILPLIAPAALAGSVLAFAAAVGNFGVPALLGIPGRFSMLTTLIYQRLNGFGPSVAGQVAVLGLILVSMAMAALALRALVLKRLAVPLGRGAPMESFDPGRWQLTAEAAIWTILAVMTILPMGALLTTSLSPAIGVPFGPATVTLSNFTGLFGNATLMRAFGNSLLLAALTAGICLLVSLPFAFLKVQLGSPIVRVLDWLVDAPWVVPGTAVALAMILAFLQPLPGIGSLYGTFAMLLAAYLARFLPLVLRPVIAAAETMEPALDEAARVTRAGPMRRIALILTPSLLPTATASTLVLAMTAVNELTLSALLWSGGNETIGVMIFSLRYEGNSTTAAAVAVASVLVVAIFALTLDRLHRWLPAGTLPWRL